MVVGLIFPTFHCGPDHILRSPQMRFIRNKQACQSPQHDSSQAFFQSLSVSLWFYWSLQQQETTRAMLKPVLRTTLAENCAKPLRMGSTSSLQVRGRGPRHQCESNRSEGRGHLLETKLKVVLQCLSLPICPCVHTGSQGYYFTRERQITGLKTMKAPGQPDVQNQEREILLQQCFSMSLQMTHNSIINHCNSTFMPLLLLRRVRHPFAFLPCRAKPQSSDTKSKHYVFNAIFTTCFTTEGGSLP